jgi:hypothetical protein
VLITVVLEATPVFWMSLAWIPLGILHGIHRVCSHFLWKRQQKGKPFGWVKWSRITTPKKWGGWGLKHLPAFAQALAAKLGWLLLKHKNLWSEVVTHKYMWSSTVLDWLRRPSWNMKGISVIWRVVLNTLPIIRRGLIWRIGNGGSVRIGIDPWIGSENAYQLPPELNSLLNHNGVHYITHLGDPHNTTFSQQAWQTGEAWDIPDQW